MVFRSLILSTLLSCNLWSQALSGTIVGTVTDAAGAVVANAKVTLTNEGTHFLRAVITNQGTGEVQTGFPVAACAGDILGCSLVGGKYGVTLDSRIRFRAWRVNLTAQPDARSARKAARPSASSRLTLVNRSVCQDARLRR